MSDSESSGAWPCVAASLDEERLRVEAAEAVKRAGETVHAVPALGADEGYTLSASASLTAPGLSSEDAERYCRAINNEPELARSLLRVLDEIERLKSELKDLEGEPPVSVSRRAR